MGRGDLPRPETTDFDAVLEAAASRRGFLGGLAALGATAFLTATTGLSSARAPHALDFEAVDTNTLDTITVPKGYRWHTVATWGDPLWSNATDFDQASRGTGETQEMAFGDNNDGMALFTDGDRHVLAVNNEYTNRLIIYEPRIQATGERDDVRKGKQPTVSPCSRLSRPTVCGAS